MRHRDGTHALRCGGVRRPEMRACTLHVAQQCGTRAQCWPSWPSAMAHSLARPIGRGTAGLWQQCIPPYRRNAMGPCLVRIGYFEHCIGRRFDGNQRLLHDITSRLNHSVTCAAAKDRICHTAKVKCGARYSCRAGIVPCGKHDGVALLRDGLHTKKRARVSAAEASGGSTSSKSGKLRRASCEIHVCAVLPCTV
jgi:hypothetical protein